MVGYWDLPWCSILTHSFSGSQQLLWDYPSYSSSHRKEETTVISWCLQWLGICYFLSPCCEMGFSILYILQRWKASFREAMWLAQASVPVSSRSRIWCLIWVFPVQWLIHYNTFRRQSFLLTPYRAQPTLLAVFFIILSAFHTMTSRWEHEGIFHGTRSSEIHVLASKLRAISCIRRNQRRSGQTISPGSQ